jgi:uncharacterized membrane protein YgcG
MKHLFRALIALLVVVPVLASQPASADVNDFSFESFDASYDLSVNSDFDNRPEMNVTETLVAVFPETDQNHGIKRSIPTSSYGIYPGLIQVQSVTDESGTPRDYEVVQEEGFTSIYIKKIDESYVHGKQIYVIKYHQSWVIRNYQSSSGADEFYWDINGTGWLQNFGRVSATVHLDPAIQENLLIDSVSCYQGTAGSINGCHQSTVSKDQMYFEANNLNAGENLTVAIPFRAGALNTSGPKVDGTIAWFLFQLSVGLVVLLLVWAAYFRFFRIKSQGNTSIIVPEYKPAASPSLLETGILARKNAHLIQALIVELAINKQIEIEAIEGEEESFILRRISSGNQELLSALGLIDVGSEIRIGKEANALENQKISIEIRKLIATTQKKLNSQGYFMKRTMGAPALGFVFGVATYILWLVSALQLDEITDAGYALVPILSFAFFAAIYWALLSKRAYTSKGSAVITHLKGLEMYIELAEKDRLEFLQSPKGASLKSSEVTGKQVLKLYEEALPWAILLGLQKQWGQVLTELYEDQGSPVWFVGTTFASQSFSHFDQALSSSLATSSSGGSGGGGSSGGGGGGGGGGGI